MVASGMSASVMSSSGSAGAASSGAGTMDSRSIGGNPEGLDPTSFIVGRSMAATIGQPPPRSTSCARARATPPVLLCSCVPVFLAAASRTRGRDPCPSTLAAAVRAARSLGAPHTGAGRARLSDGGRHDRREPVSTCRSTATRHPGPQAPLRRWGIATAAGGSQNLPPRASTGDLAAPRWSGRGRAPHGQAGCPGEPGPRGRHRVACRRDRSCCFQTAGPGPAAFVPLRRPMADCEGRRSCRCIRSRNSRRASLTRHFTVPTGASSSAAASA